MGQEDWISEISMLSSYLVLPPEGHLEAILNVIDNLQQKCNFKFAYDQCILEFTISILRNANEFCGDIKEDLLHNLPKPRGKEVNL